MFIALFPLLTGSIGSCAWRIANGRTTEELAYFDVLFYVNLRDPSSFFGSSEFCFPYGSTRADVEDRLDEFCRTLVTASLDGVERAARAVSGSALVALQVGRSGSVR